MSLKTVSPKLTLRFRECKLYNIETTPIRLHLLKSKNPSKIEFVNCGIFDDKKGPAVRIMWLGGTEGTCLVTGNISIFGRRDAKVDFLNTPAHDIELRLDSIRTWY